MVAISVIYGLCTGRASELTSAVFDSGTQALNLVLSLIGNLAIWGGIMEIAKDSGLYEYICKITSPLLSKVFRGIKKDSRAIKAISANIAANILGLGNAATPSGIEAMKELEKEESIHKRATENMVIFVLLNSTGLSLIPTSIATLRLKYSSIAPTGTFIYSAAISLIVTAAEIAAVKLIGRKKR